MCSGRSRHARRSSRPGWARGSRSPTPAPVEFEALDGAPVRLVLLLAGPEGDRGAHVRLLSRVSRVLAQHQTREALLAARTPEEIVEVFAEAEAALR